jgi:hypothetical protein
MIYLPPPMPTKRKLTALPQKDAAFIEPMECLSVPRLPEGSQWLWEILCNAPHNISYVAMRIMCQDDSETRGIRRLSGCVRTRTRGSVVKE